MKIIASTFYTAVTATRSSSSSARPISRTSRPAMPLLKGLTMALINKKAIWLVDSPFEVKLTLFEKNVCVRCGIRHDKLWEWQETKRLFPEPIITCSTAKWCPSNVSDSNITYQPFSAMLVSIASPAVAALASCLTARSLDITNILADGEQSDINLSDLTKSKRLSGEEQSLIFCQKFVSNILSLGYPTWFRNLRSTRFLMRYSFVLGVNGSSILYSWSLKYPALMNFQLYLHPNKHIVWGWIC